MGDNFFEGPRRIPDGGNSVPTCRNCQAEIAVEDLVRHDHDELVMVHCPKCGFTMGTYNRHSEPPRMDRQGD